METKRTCDNCDKEEKLFNAVEYEHPSGKAHHIKLCIKCKDNLNYWQNRKPTPSRRLPFGSGCKAMSINHLRLIG